MVELKISESLPPGTQFGYCWPPGSFSEWQVSWSEVTPKSMCHVITGSCTECPSGHFSGLPWLDFEGACGHLVAGGGQGGQ